MEIGTCVDCSKISWLIAGKCSPCDSGNPDSKYITQIQRELHLVKAMYEGRVRWI